MCCLAGLQRNLSWRVLEVCHGLAMVVLLWVLEAHLLFRTKDPRIRFYFEISVRKKHSDIALFISYIGARKLSTVHSDYSRIHQRNFSIVNDDNTVSDVSLLVAKDLSKKIKKDPNSSSAAGKHIRAPFSSLEDGCGLIELCKHDVWPLPCEGELCCSSNS